MSRPCTHKSHGLCCCLHAQWYIRLSRTELYVALTFSYRPLGVSWIRLTVSLNHGHLPEVLLCACLFCCMCNDAISDVRSVHSETSLTSKLKTRMSNYSARNRISKSIYDGVSKSFRTESKINICLSLVLIVEKQHKWLWRQNSLDSQNSYTTAPSIESCTICSSRSRRSVQKLLNTPS
jgi:hypothetical protein